MTWNILGISDEVEICEHCGRTDLKRTVCLTNGAGEIYVGTTCAAAMLQRTTASVRREAETKQFQVEKDLQNEEWSAILNTRHYQFLKLNVHSKAETRERKVHKGFSFVVEQSGLPQETVLQHLISRWGKEKMSCLALR